MEPAAIATLIMVGVTALMAIGVFWSTLEARKSRKLSETVMEENRKSAERSRIRELIGQGLDPLIESMDEVEHAWRQRLSEFSFLNLFDVSIGGQVNSKFVFNWTLYYDLIEIEPSLIRMMAEYEDKVTQFWDSLLDLSNLEHPETLITVSELANVNTVKELIRENAHNFQAEIEKIRAKFHQVRDKYRHEYHLTEEELQDLKKKIERRSLRMVL